MSSLRRRGPEDKDGGPKGPLFLRLALGILYRWRFLIKNNYLRFAAPQGFQLPSWSKQEFPNYGMIFARGVKVPRDGVDKPVRQFWIPVDDKLFEIARTATSGVELKRCIEAQCLVHPPKVVVGGNGVSGSAFVDNAAFRTWAFDTFKAQVLDMESAAVAHVAATNAVPFLAFRSLSDLAGGGAGENEMQTFEKLASENSVAVLRAFLKALPK